MVAFICVEFNVRHLKKKTDLWDFPGGPMVKNLPSSVGDWGLIPGQGTKGGGNGTPLQYSCLENPMDGRVW